MFTGLIEELAIVDQVRRSGDRQTVTLRLGIKAPLVAKDAKIGDSIAVSGCCLTVVAKQRTVLAFDVGAESLSRTHFDRLKVGHRVNLERSLQLGDRLGGHLVTGHVDGLGTLTKRRDDGNWSHFTIRAHPRLMRQMVAKGSITVDGVSLTVVVAEEDFFTVALIPHTLENTTLGELEIGQVVNLETDLLAKYVERQLEFHPKILR